jgi:hypothetical protein
MRPASRFLALLVAALAVCSAAERRSWNQVRYVGGTLAIKASPYDWNTTMTVAEKPPMLTIAIAPASVFGGRQQTLRLAPAAITWVVFGPGAWQRVADVPGVQLPTKPRTLFGLLRRGDYLGILYRGDNGKPAALLFETYFAYGIANILEAMTGKPSEFVR